MQINNDLAFDLVGYFAIINTIIIPILTIISLIVIIIYLPLIHKRLVELLNKNKKEE